MTVTVIVFMSMCTSDDRGTDDSRISHEHDTLGVESAHVRCIE